jgi:hypothetical protein
MGHHHRRDHRPVDFVVRAIAAMLILAGAIVVAWHRFERHAPRPQAKVFPTLLCISTPFQQERCWDPSKPDQPAVVQPPVVEAPAPSNPAEEINTPAPELRGAIDVPEEVHRDPVDAGAGAADDIGAGQSERQPDGADLRGAGHPALHRRGRHGHRRLAPVTDDAPAFPAWMLLTPFN